MVTIFKTPIEERRMSSQEQEPSSGMIRDEHNFPKTGLAVEIFFKETLPTNSRQKLSKQHH
jgi:hypothetical protein